MKIFLVDLESIPTRYTCEWKTHVPQLLRDNGFDVEVIEGDLTIPDATTPGAFLNFGGTNMYKATQLHKLAELFTLGGISAGDHIVFTDAWHPAIINVKYMSELLNIPVITHGLWHAGSYDPNDFLGRLVGDKPWIRHAEQSFIEAFNYNWLATDAHFELITKTYQNVFFKTGWPMEYTKPMIEPVPFTEKKNIIVFPHRVAPEKRVDLFEELSQRPELWKYEFRIPMNENLTKAEYHKLLQQSKFAVSFAEQETLGISMYEAACAGAMPIVPNRLSYTEMYHDFFKHDDTIDNIVYMIQRIEDKDVTQMIAEQSLFLHEKFFSATNLINKLKEYNEQRTA
jgi:glycosyltransferase involved in cell wall biosynthesis